MLTFVAVSWLACSSAPPPEAPVEAEAPPAPAPAPPHGASPHTAPAPAPAPAGLGVFQGVVRDVVVGGDQQFVRLEGCDSSLWVAGTPQPLSVGQTLVTLGGTERAAEVPGQPGSPTVRFVSRMAPALQPLDCSMQGRTGYPHVGTVLQAHIAAGYVYAEVAYCDRVGWIAGPEAQLTKGSLVGHADGTPQAGFESKSLGRRFDHITFVPSLAPVDGELSCP